MGRKLNVREVVVPLAHYSIAHNSPFLVGPEPFIMASRTKCAFARAWPDSVLEVETKLMKAYKEDCGIRGLYTAAESPS